MSLSGYRSKRASAYPFEPGCAAEAFRRKNNENWLWEALKVSKPKLLKQVDNVLISKTFNQATLLEWENSLGNRTSQFKFGIYRTEDTIIAHIFLARSHICFVFRKGTEIVSRLLLIGLEAHAEKISGITNQNCSEKMWISLSKMRKNKSYSLVPSQEVIEIISCVERMDYGEVNRFVARFGHCNFLGILADIPQRKWAIDPNSQNRRFEH
jgi:hypothetical protein